MTATLAWSPLSPLRPWAMAEREVVMIARKGTASVPVVHRSVDVFILGSEGLGSDFRLVMTIEFECQADVAQADIWRFAGSRAAAEGRAPFGQRGFLFGIGGRPIIDLEYE